MIERIQIKFKLFHEMSSVSYIVRENYAVRKRNGG